MDGEPPFITKTIVIENVFNPNYDYERLCTCGHEYGRHFDWMEDNYYTGCKYQDACECEGFEADETIS